MSTNFSGELFLGKASEDAGPDKGDGRAKSVGARSIVLDAVAYAKDVAPVFDAAHVGGHVIDSGKGLPIQVTAPPSSW